MATVTASTPLVGVAGSYAGVNYSGTFIPTLWSSKLNRKFYLSTVFGEIANTDFQGEIAGLGDKVVINQIPTIAITDYTIGGMTDASSYAVPTPSSLELVIDKAKKFTFQVNDVIAHQAKPNMMETFSNDASQQMKIAVDRTVLYGDSAAKPGIASDFGATNIAAANFGATAGAVTAGYNLGTATTPVTLTASNILSTLTAMAGVLDEQNIPETERWLVIDPLTRNLLMQSNLAQAQFMGDDKSMVRNGKIGQIDRFTVYVSNQLPKAAATQDYWGGAAAGTAKRRILLAGHKSAVTFASQMTKMETVRNPYDFGDYVRGLNVFGWKTLQPTGLAIAIVA
jgi:hypothetical protein